MNNEIQDVISGKSQVRYGANIQAAINYLRTCEKTGALDKTDKYFKRKETESLRKYIENQSLWIQNINLDNYVSEGAEQKVYLKDNKSVIKLNDDKISPIKCKIQELDLKQGKIEVDVYLPIDISGMESAELNHIYSAKLKRIS